MPVDADFSLVGSVEARQQVGDGRFAAARLADQGDALAGIGEKADPPERGAFGAGVGEGDVGELDVTAGVPEVCAARILFRGSSMIPKTLSAAARPRWMGALMSVSRLESGASSMSMAVMKEMKSPTVVWSLLAWRRATAMMTASADGRNWTIGPSAAAAMVQRMLRRRCSWTDWAGEPLLFVSLPTENLHHLVAFDRFLENLRDRPLRQLEAPRYPPQSAAEGAHGDGDERHHDDGDQAQFPVEVEQPGGEPSTERLSLTSVVSVPVAAPATLAAS